MKNVTILAAIIAAASVLVAEQSASAQHIHAITEIDGSRTVTVDSGRYQGVYSANPVYAEKGLLFDLLHPGEPLSSEQLSGRLSGGDYETYKGLYSNDRAGIVLERIGLVTTLVSMSACLVDGVGAWLGGWEMQRNRVIAECAGMGAGVVFIVAGIPLRYGGNGKAEGIASRYNESIRKDGGNGSLTFGGTASGLGIALNF